MIVDAIGGFLLGLLEGLLSVLPDAEAIGLDGIGDAIGLMKVLNGALPVTEALYLATASLAVIAGIFAWRLFKLLYELIPFKFT